MIMSEKNLRIIIVVFGLMFLYSLVVWSKNEHEVKKQKEYVKSLQHKIDSIQSLNDSLSSVLFPVEIELGRYQVAYEIFMERNPKAASQYGTIISEETE